MPYPAAPEIATSYTAVEQALGDGTLPGQELDVDLASIRASVTAVIEFVKHITRSDGKLANGIVTQEALGAALVIGFEPPSVWATGVAYTTRSIVFEGTKIYLCLAAHTSSVFATDLASGRWSLLADLAPAGGALVASNNLSDLPDKPNARANLGLGSMATAASGTGAAQFRTNLQNEAFFQPLAAGLTSWAAIARAAGFDTFAATPSSANLRALLTDETGSGALLFAGGAMGTPSSLDLTNATGLTTSGIAAATLVTASETIGANNNDTTIPTSAAVKAYADANSIALQSSQATTSGTAFDFTGIPAAVKRVTMLLSKVSLSGTDVFLVQLGTSGGPVTTGYVGWGSAIAASAVGGGPATAGIRIDNVAAAGGVSGRFVAERLAPGSNIWICSFNGVRLSSLPSTADASCNSGGEIDLGAELTQIRLTRSGTNTFDNGLVGASWEF